MDRQGPEHHARDDRERAIGQYHQDCPASRRKRAPAKVHPGLIRQVVHGPLQVDNDWLSGAEQRTPRFGFKPCSEKATPSLWIGEIPVRTASFPAESRIL